MGNWKEIWKFFKNEKSKSFLKKNTFYRPWGKYINLFNGNGFLLKELVINSKSSISLQKHLHRSERWTIIKGKPKVSINKKKYFLKVGQSIFVPKKSIHRIENIYSTPVQIAEVQMGSILKETDIIRYKDIYGRIN
jgi:mannose-6-phosphate isomerase-like protein (cupin superfamily)